MRSFAVRFVPILWLLSLKLAAHQAPNPAPEAHHQGVTSRGDRAMGFSHQTTTHHFRLDKSGGVIDVSANDPKDFATRDQIRMHLSHIIQRFAAGDFNVPMFIHDTTPPGAPVMAKLRSQIRYNYCDTPGGGKVQILTANSQAIEAIHAFLRFQISDHQTSDPTGVQ
jgi:hypothetical protein